MVKTGKLPGDGEILFSILAGKVIKRADFLTIKKRLVKGKEGYRSKGGTDYADLEAGKCFADYLNRGIIRELK